MTDRSPVVQDGPRGIAIFTPEQVKAARTYADASRAAFTQAKYLQHWTAFDLWCREVGHRPLPADPAVVAVHLSGLADSGLTPQTLSLRLAAIGYAHRQAGEAIPHKVRGGTVMLDVLAGARRKWGKPPDRKAAADSDVIWSMLHEIKGDMLKDVRDRALLSFGMISCVRRSEITALNVPDIVRSPEGLRVTIRRSKSDQESVGSPLRSPPAAASSRCSTWRPGWSAPPSPRAPLFRRLLQCGGRVLADRMSDRSVAEIVKAREGSRAGSRRLRRALAAGRVPDQHGPGQGVDLEDAGAEPP